MFGSNKPTRIGDILMERALISRSQLMQALDLQQARHLLSDGESTRGAHRETPNEIGEILIELGFITRNQLKKNLARQNRLRKTTLAFTLVAPLFTMACGGGGGANASTPSSGTNPVSSVVVQSSSKTPEESSQSSVSSQSSAAPQSPSSESSVSSISSASVASTSSTSVESKSSSSVSSAQPSSIQSSSVQSSSLKSSSSQASSISKTSSSSSSTLLQGPVVLYWTIPSRRENGEVLDINEISGYEVRYKLRNKKDYIYIKIPGAFNDTYYFDYLSGDYEFQIAAVDVDGIYSQFVPINPAH